MTSFYTYGNRPTGTLDNGPILTGYQKAIDRQQFRGMASLTHNNKTLVFRTNPNSVTWSYKLNTAVENTYGGRVIQILSTAMEDLRVVIECGLGGWPYLIKVAQFMRDMMIDQRDPKNGPGTFVYTTRGWNMKVYAASIPFQDSITETTRELTLMFKIQEDVTGVITKQTISAELAKLQAGIGFAHTQFNTGAGTLNDGTTAPDIFLKGDLGGILTTAEIPAANLFPASRLGTPGANLIGNITNNGGITNGVARQ